ncbi:MAG TPA: MarR family transcriptional regulator [Thermoleophilaceae bacterium]|nr:MarR family transcriptional regulator [Thermoleophilaceae bacterium]
MSAENCTGETEIRTWIRFLTTHSAITRELEARLMGAHGLTLSDYDVLVQLARAPGRKLRNIELAKAVVLTRSGVTRLVDGLVKDGLVMRSSCTTDKRGTFVALTDEGARRLRAAACTHIEGVRELFVERLGQEGLKQMDALLELLPSGTTCLESRACIADPDALEIA